MSNSGAACRGPSWTTCIPCECQNHSHPRLWERPARLGPRPGRESHTALGNGSRPPSTATTSTITQALRGSVESALKCLYLAIISLDPTGKGRQRWTNRWKAALNAFDITFDGRLSAGRK